MTGGRVGIIVCGMADRTVRISETAWRQFKQAALDQGITLKAYLEQLAEEQLADQQGEPIVLSFDPLAKSHPLKQAALDAGVSLKAYIDQLAAAARPTPHEE